MQNVLVDGQFTSSVTLPTFGFTAPSAGKLVLFASSTAGAAILTYTGSPAHYADLDGAAQGGSPSGTLTAEDSTATLTVSQGDTFAIALAITAGSAGLYISLTFIPEGE